MSFCSHCQPGRQRGGKLCDGFHFPPRSCVISSRKNCRIPSDSSVHYPLALALLRKLCSAVMCNPCTNRASTTSTMKMTTTDPTYSPTVSAYLATLPMKFSRATCPSLTATPPLQPRKLFPAPSWRTCSQKRPRHLRQTHGPTDGSNTEKQSAHRCSSDQQRAHADSWRFCISLRSDRPHASRTGLGNRGDDSGKASICICTYS